MVKQISNKLKLNENTKAIWWLMGLVAVVITLSLSGFTSWAAYGIGRAYSLSEEVPKVCERVSKIEQRNMEKDKAWTELDRKLERQEAILVNIAKATNAQMPVEDLLK